MRLHAITVRKGDAQALRELLGELRLIDGKHRPASAPFAISFPLSREPDMGETLHLKKRFPKLEFSIAAFEPYLSRPKSLKDALRGKLTETETKNLVTSFDTLGDIAIIEIPKELSKKEKAIANALLESNPRIKTVCKKASARKGKYRAQKLTIIAGKRKKIAEYRESNCLFKFHVEKSFFSPRLGTERLRISKLIKKDEVVAVLFAGVGPFAIVFAKNSKMKKAYAVELNPNAAKDMEQNIKLNKVEGRVIPFLGDVREVVPAKLKGKCDRVVMPLPKDAHHFLEDAFMCLNPLRGGVIHFYTFVPRENMYREALSTIRGAASKHGCSIRVLRKRKVRSYSPDTVQVVVDFSAKRAKAN